MPRDAFISHASVDAELALSICEGLEQRGLTCWIAPRDVRSEGTYGTEIIRGLRECAAFLIVLTAASSESQQVEREAERASHYQKRIIPLSFGGGEPGERLEFYTAGRQRVACAATIDERFLDRLAQVIRGEPPVVPERPRADAAPRAASRPTLAIAGVVAAVVVVATLGLYLSGALTGRLTPPAGERPGLAPVSEPQPAAPAPRPTDPPAAATGPPSAAKETNSIARGSTPPAAPPAGNVPEGRRPDVPATSSKPETARGGRATAPDVAGAATALVVNGVTLRFAVIPGGTFRMGCGPGDGDCSDDEKSRRVVAVDPFQISVTEVTQAFWQATMGENPSDFQGTQQPVENVSWQDAKKFVEKLNERGDGFTYALPMEADWEYAARAGSGVPEQLAKVAWFGLLTSSEVPARPQNVGRKQANAWGLFDMLGNVAEWCEDWFSPNYQRVIRGGAWTDSAAALRFSARGKAVPTTRTYAIGIRVVRTRAGS